ncbi:MAG: tryptophan synthase subunit alpha [bacterium]|nr:tryptophan synthase subunit alpha [bacterium]
MAPTIDLFALTRDSRQRSHKLLVMYLTCGYCEHNWTFPLAREVFAAGADIIELGMPFSDPLADGPTIQAASQHALDNGTTSKEYFEGASQISELGPTLFMGYLNSVTSIPHFLERAHDAQLCGLVLPGGPVTSESFSSFEQFSARLNLPRIPFISPTSSQDRIAQIDVMDAPFIYAVSIAGVTGARAQLDTSVDTYLAGLKKSLKTPFLAGFGVSSPETARRIVSIADGVIVGSALLDGIGSSASLEQACKFTSEFVQSLREAIDEPLSA